MIHTPVNDDGGGRFSLVYDMNLDRHAQDWDARGADKWDVSQASRPGDQTKVLCGQLVASGSDCLWLHKVPLKGDVDLTLTFFVAGYTEASTVTVVLGLDAKKRFVGAQLGQVLVRSDGKRLTPLSGPDPDVKTFAGGKDQTVRLARTGDKVALTWNGTDCGTIDAPSDGGRWGILARSVRLGIRRVEVHGTPELPKK